MTEQTKIFAVDRIEGAVVVLVPNEGEAEAVPRSALPVGVREGTVVRVPLDEDGSLLWAEAARDLDLEEAFLQEGRDRMERLKERDPGGDVIL